MLYVRYKFESNSQRGGGVQQQFFDVYAIR